MDVIVDITLQATRGRGAFYGLKQATIPLPLIFPISKEFRISMVEGGRA